MRYLCTLLLLAGLMSGADPLRVVLVVGGHDYDNSLHSVFEGQKEFTTYVMPHPPAFRQDLRQRFDVVVLYDMVQDPGPKIKENLQAFIESGKGCIVLHHAVADYNDWPWFRQMAGCAYLLKPEGSMPASTFKHDEWIDYKVVMKHPVTEGVSSGRIYDEAYKGMWHSPDNKVLLEANHPLSDKPVAWLSPYSKARVVTIQLGHGREAHENPNFQRLVRNAIQWVAGR